MLKDRRALLENDIAKLTTACGKLYLSIVVSEADPEQHALYNSLRTELSNLTTDLMIVSQLIAEGQE